jgi:PiT family inorganic phosphate transporter
VRGDALLDPLTFVLIIVFLAWAYDFCNGMNDCANAIATTVSTGALTPRKAIALARTLNILGALVSTRVAKTVGKGIVGEDVLGGPLGQAVLISAIAAAVIWVVFCTRKGIPISVTHSLVGGLVGSGALAAGFGAIQGAGIKKVIIAMVLSPLFGFIFGFLVMVAMLWLSRNMATRKATRVFRHAQIASASFMAFTHGQNDAQNAMGVITAALVAGGFISSFRVPLWVMLGSAVFMGLGTQVGGWRVIRTMGMRLAKLRPIHGFSAEASGSLVIEVSSLLGAPVSTTHCISTAIMGAGATERLSAVKWGVAANIVVTWVLTIPGAALIGALLFAIIRAFAG